MMTATTTATIDELGIFYFGISFRIALVRSLALSLSLFLWRGKSRREALSLGQFEFFFSSL
jgi:hypothetical protein